MLWLDKAFEDGVGANGRDPFTRIAEKCLWFLAGDQWATPVPDARNLTHRKLLKARGTDNRIVDNQIIVHFPRQRNKLYQALSSYEASPATADYADRQAAALATRVLKWRERADKEDILRYQTVGQIMACGEVARLTYFDPKKESPSGTLGDIHTELWNVFQYAKDPASRDVWPPRWIVLYDAMNVDAVKERWGVDVEAESVADGLHQLQMLALNVATNAPASRPDLEKRVVVKRMYCAPSEKYPSGHVFVWARNKLLDEHDFQWGVYPLSICKYYDIPNRLYGMSYIEPLLQDQVRINTVWSQIQEINDKRMRLDTISNSGLEDFVQTVVDEETGQRHIRLLGADNIQIVKYDVDTRLAEMGVLASRENMLRKSGQNDPATGQISKGDVTATELQLAREGQAEAISDVIFQMDTHNIEIAKIKIALAEKGYQQAQLLSNLGQGARDEAPYFWGADLRGVNHVIAVPVVKMTPGVRQKMRVDAQQMGLFGPYPGGLAQQYAARESLRKMGLVEDEEALAEVYGPFDQLKEMIHVQSQVSAQVEMAQFMAMMQQKMMTIAQAQAGGGLGPEAGPPPGEVDGMAEGGGADGAEAGALGGENPTMTSGGDGAMTPMGAGTLPGGGM